INIGSLALKVWPMFAFAGTWVAATKGPLIPVDPEPAQPLQNHIHRLLRIALSIRIFNPQNKLTARMPCIKPVKERRPGSPNMEVAGGTGRKPNPCTHPCYKSFFY